MICFVHGAVSTRRSFAYVKLKLSLDGVDFEYKVSTPFDTNLENLLAFVDRHKVTTLIGHSYGGLLTACVKMLRPELKVAIISAPLGGSFFANFLSYFAFHQQLMMDMRTTNPIFGKLRAHLFDDKTLVLATRCPDSAIMDSDGVVSFESQTAIRGCRYEYFDLNHSEILLDESVCDVLEAYLHS